MSAAIRPPKLTANPEHIEMWIGSVCAPFLSKIGFNDFDSNASTERAVSKARRELEFATGRRYAESLLKRLGNSDQVWTNPDRSPAWPVGFCGSISHSQNWTWAVVGQQRQIESVGIDTEAVVTSETRSQILLEIATEDEWSTCAATDLSPEQILSVVFSAKEAFYNCCYPKVKQYFGFEHAIVEQATANRLRIRTNDNHPSFESMPATLDVHFLVAGQDVFTATWMEPTQ